MSWVLYRVIFLLTNAYIAYFIKNGCTCPFWMKGGARKCCMFWNFDPTQHRNGEEEIRPYSELKDYRQLWMNYHCMVEIARTLINADHRLHWVLVDAGSFRFPACLWCSWAFELLAICSLLLAGNEQPGWNHLCLKFIDGFHFVRRSNQCWAGLIVQSI